MEEREERHLTAYRQRVNKLWQNMVCHEIGENSRSHCERAGSEDEDPNQTKLQLIEAYLGTFIVEIGILFDEIDAS
jgi:hypothetical protein